MPLDQARTPSPRPTLIALVVGAVAVGIALALPFSGSDASAASGLLLAAALVLGASGVAKVLHPETASDAMSRIGIRTPRWSMRGAGIAEIVLGTAAALAGSTALAVLVAVAYLAFAAVAWRMSRAEDLTSCGCFGAAGARPGPIHVVVDLALAGGALAAAATSGGGAVALVTDTPWLGSIALVGAALGASGVVALLTVAAETDELARGDAAPSLTFHLVEDA